MILFSHKKILSSQKGERSKKYNSVSIYHEMLSTLPQLWQLFDELPEKLKNGKSLLLEEEIILHKSLLFTFDYLELYLLYERKTRKSNKYIVTLELKAYYQNNLIVTIGIVLLSEVSWNENIPKNYQG